jgi:hypothetical protein
MEARMDLVQHARTATVTTLPFLNLRTTAPSLASALLHLGQLSRDECNNAIMARSSSLSQPPTQDWEES